MTRIDDVMLMAYVDGEIDAESAREIEAAINADPAIADRARAFRDSAAFTRAAYTAVAQEPIPDRLLAVLAPAERPAGNVVAFTPKHVAARRVARFAVAASVAAIIVGLGATYSDTLRGWIGEPTTEQRLAQLARQQTSERWLDNVAGYFREYSANAREQRQLVDFTAEHGPEIERYFGERLNRRLTLPDLTAEGFNLAGGRVLIIGGRPAAQLVYTNEANEFVGVVISFTSDPDVPARAAARDDVNLVYLREGGYAYGFVGTQTPDKLRRIADRSLAAFRGI